MKKSDKQGDQVEYGILLTDILNFRTTLPPPTMAGYQSNSVPAVTATASQCYTGNPGAGGTEYIKSSTGSASIGFCLGAPQAKYKYASISRFDFLPCLACQKRYRKQNSDKEKSQFPLLMRSNPGGETLPEI